MVDEGRVAAIGFLLFMLAVAVGVAYVARYL